MAKDTIKNQNTQTADENNKYFNNVSDTDQEPKKRPYIRWILYAVGLIIICLLIYQSCFPKSTRISPKNITYDSQTLSITYSDTKTITIDGGINNWKTNAYSEFVWTSTANNTVKFTFYVKAKIGNNVGIYNFDVIQSKHTDSGTDYSIWSFGDGAYSFNDENQTDQSAINFAEWLHSTSTIRASIPDSFDWWSLILQLIIPLLLIIMFFWYFKKMSAMQGGTDENGGGIGGLFSMGKSLAKITKSNIKFSDVAGIEEEKQELIEIVDYLTNPQKYVAMGARTPRGIILYGPPGTGKTLLAKAVAGEASVPFFQISGSAFEDMLVGVGAKRVRDLFAKAKKAAPAIIFIDEIDSVASKRGKNDVVGGGGGIADQTINQLLAEMDGFSTKTGVVVMAATNRLDVLDEAILRPGRFDRHIQINLPDIKEREAILKIHSRNKNISSSVNLTDIARRTPGFSGAQLENVLNEATLMAVRLNKHVIGEEELDEGIDRVIAGPAKKTRVISEQEKRQIAIHEAGHAIVGLYTPGSEKVEKITIIPRGKAGGYTITNPEKQETVIQKKSELIANVTALLGGRSAELFIYGNDGVSTGAANDLYRATGIVKAMVMQLGMSKVGLTQFAPSEGTTNPYAKPMYSEASAIRIDTEVEKTLQECCKKALAIIEKNKDELNIIVECLLLLETIVKPQIDYIHKNQKLPEEALEMKKKLSNEKKSSSTDSIKKTKN